MGKCDHILYFDPNKKFFKKLLEKNSLKNNFQLDIRGDFNTKIVNFCIEVFEIKGGYVTVPPYI